MKIIDLLSFIQKTAIKIGTSTPFIVGGVPRDKVLGKLEEMSDLDITTGDETAQYLAKEVNIALNKVMKANFKKGIDGHSSIQLGNLKIDFSPNFKVLHIDSYLKKMGISNPTSMQEEVFSRDFTCNTLLMSLDLKDIQDPTGHGFQDMKNKIIKTCLAPEVTLKEFNRIVRAIYLAAKLDFEVDPAIIEFVKKDPELFKTVTAPKALEEKLTKAMKYNPTKTLDLLTKMNLESFIPAAKQLEVRE